ncbi:hypothetical protein [Phaffia rhodozyma]|uniref:Uncharacterized protein n=1 Tax=Phaffia rhodozyma TaxID=264483 RepID=A0A0F7STJ9_PHARH|nr:hypothetical protein [Phaffia rhodozyma]
MSSSGKIDLFDEDGALREPLYLALCHIFSKYLTPLPPTNPTAQGSLHPPPPPSSSLSSTALDLFAKDTNGAPFEKSTKDEIFTFFDTVKINGGKEEGLTMKGFEEMMTLQTENDEEETWRDLAAHGFDRSLNLVPSKTTTNSDGK